LLFRLLAEGTVDISAAAVAKQGRSALVLVRLSSVIGR